jgi:HEAT repeat protein
MPAADDLAPNIAERWSAIEAMVRDGDLAQLPKLCSAVLAQEPEAAPAIIHGVASLAVQGSEADRALAGKTLARWLTEERKRDTRDASGNVVNIVEALGDLGGDEAVTSLIDVLDREEDLALQTTAAERLATLGDARAMPAVTRFGERLSRSPEPSDAFEKELHAEATKTAIDARGRLSPRDEKKEPNE